VIQKSPFKRRDRIVILLLVLAFAIIGIVKGIFIPNNTDLIFSGVMGVLAIVRLLKEIFTKPS
jgi:hypothetical protein